MIQQPLAHEPQHAEIGRIVADVFLRAPEELARCRARLDDRERPAFAFAGMDLDRERIVDPEFAIVVFALALAAIEHLAIAVIALVEREQGFGHVSLQPIQEITALVNGPAL